MVDEKLLQSRTIDWLRFPMAFMVVLIHCGLDLPKSVDWSCFDMLHMNYAIRIAGSNVFSHISIPLFFLISGFLFFAGIDPYDNIMYRRKLYSRVKSLFVPYVLWICIAIMFSMLLKCLTIFFRGADWNELLSWAHDNMRLSSFWNIKEYDSFRHNWLGMIYPQPYPSSCPYLVPLWFVRNLIVLVLLSPLLGRIIHKGGKIILLILFLCYLSLIFPYFPGLDIESLFYYYFGGWLAINNYNMVISFSVLRKPCSYAFIILGVILVYFNGYENYWGNYLYPFCIFSGVIAVFSNAAYFLEKSVNKRILLINDKIIRLKGTVFFIYASHTLFLRFIYAFLNKIFPDKIYWDIPIYIILPVCTICLCLILFYMMKKITPSILKVLNGGR